MIYPEAGHAERNVSGITGGHRKESCAQGVREALKAEWRPRWSSVSSDISKSFKGADFLWALLSSELLFPFLKHGRQYPTPLLHENPTARQVLALQKRAESR